MQFNELNINPEILRAIEEMGYTEATDIQSAAIPAILSGKDVTGRSSTGTGKTAAFAIPAVQLAAESGKAAVLVLSPTRELALQISGEVRKLSKYIPSISATAVYGGSPMPDQIRALKTAKIVIGTPGRVLDHLRRKTLRLDNLRMIVLDEADEMLNMGFIDDIRTVLESANDEHQTILFSATMPQAIIQITKDFQREPEFIAADGGQKTVAGIKQSVYHIPQGSKIDTLKLLIEYHKPLRALVFTNTKKMADELTENLNDSGFRAAALHGDLKQSQRNSVMADFKNGRIKLLIATDVAARGIDVNGIEAVFNYDIPQDNEYYIHRIGRTGRAGQAGASYTLAANRGQAMRVRDIERYIGTKIEAMEVPTIESIVSHQSEEFANSLRTAVDENQGYEWLELIKKLEADGYAALDIAAALCAKVNHKATRIAGLRNVKAMTQQKPSAPRREHGGSGNSAGRTWISVDIGSDERIAPNFIVGAIVEATNLRPADIGKINIFPEHTEIEMTCESADEVLREMKNAQIKKQKVQFTIISSKKEKKPYFKSDKSFAKGRSNDKRRFSKN